MADQPELLLRWRRSWPDSERDFVALYDRAPGGTVGRIFWEKSPVGEVWSWSMTAFGPGIRRPYDCRGREGSAREAAARVETAWFQAIGDA